MIKTILLLLCVGLSAHASDEYYKTGQTDDILLMEVVKPNSADIHEYHCNHIWTSLRHLGTDEESITQIRCFDSKTSTECPAVVHTLDSAISLLQSNACPWLNTTLDH